MLILTRLTGERLRIGEDVVVKILETSSGRVVLGIEAPRDIQVARELQPDSDEWTTPRHRGNERCA